MILITENISFPIDEGIKKYSFKLADYGFKNHKMQVYSHKSNNSIKGLQLPKNKLFLSFSFLRAINKKEENIIYIPNASSTFASFLRLKVVQIFSLKPTVLIGIQKRTHSNWQRFFIKHFLRPNLMFVFSNREKDYYESLGMKVEITSIGVNIKKYVPISGAQKLELRKKLKLSLDKKILLHVGHINKGRNISVLKGLVKKSYHVVVIGSTCFNDDENLKDELQNSGIKIVSEYIEKINEYYQAVDAYVFPVLNDSSVIEFPLSILEAMACNLPILSTPFGSIPYHFQESDYFKYFHDEKSLMEKSTEIFQNSDLTYCDNASKIQNEYSWERQFQKLINKIDII